MANILKLIVGLIISVLLFSGCNPYKMVRNDRYRTKAERDLLAVPCRDEFPCGTGKPDTTKLGYDSSEYNAALDALYQQVDQNILLQDSIINLIKLIEQTHGSLTSEQVYAMMLAQRSKDSAQIIRNFLKWYKPKPIVERVEVKIPIKDSAALNEVNRKLDRCQDNEEKLENELKDAKKWKKRFWIAVGSGVLFILGLIYFLISQLKKKNTLLKNTLKTVPNENTPKI